jgi:hypothetical protein
MLRFIRRLNYRDRVFDYLGALLLFYPRRRRVSKDFPGVRNAIGSSFEAGLAPSSCALKLAAGIIQELLRQLDLRERKVVLAELARLEWHDFHALAARRLARPAADTRNGAIFVGQLTGIAMFMARRMKEEGTLSPVEYHQFVSELAKDLCIGSGAELFAHSKAGPLSDVIRVPAQTEAGGENPLPPR